MPNPRVVVSIGFGRLHGALAAREASDRDCLDLAVTGAYPTPFLRRITAAIPLINRGWIARLMDRDEGIPMDRLVTFGWIESIYAVFSRLVRVRPLGLLPARVCAALMRLYAQVASFVIWRRAPGAEILHVISGYGHASIASARRNDVFVLVDHGIAHPLALDDLVGGSGDSGKAGLFRRSTARRDHPHWKAILSDLEQADAVVVNSDFIKETFVAQGWDPERIFVAYLGIDDNFVEGLEPASVAVDDGPLRMLFAGRVEERKGVRVLAEALAGLDDVEWQLTLAGPVSPDIRADCSRFLADPRVDVCGPITRGELRQRMQAAPLFVFPSFAEGSARVIFEAMASGCFVITTPTSGSIVESGVHGELVVPHDPESLAAAIRNAAGDRAQLAEVGARNAALIAQDYRQSAYGERLASIYREIHAKRAN